MDTIKIVLYIIRCENRIFKKNIQEQLLKILKALFIATDTALKDTLKAFDDFKNKQ